MPRYQSPMKRLGEYIWDKMEDMGLDIFGQIGFLFGLGTIASFGVYVAIPALYGDDSSVGRVLKCFGYICAAEVFVNWICIKTVDCTYNPSKHGAKPDYVAIGEDYTQVRADVSRVSDAAVKDENVTSTLRKDATAVPLTYGNEEEATNDSISGSAKTVCPYFSWKPCLRCNRPRPPRAYHCPICDRCILKRDHHCFVTGVCIGDQNLRHFAVMLFWSVISTTFAGAHSLLYFYFQILPYCSIFDFFLPIAMLRGMVFRVAVKHLVLISLGWLLCGFWLWSLAFGRRVYKVVTSGLTSFEQWENIRLNDSKPVDKKLKAVFGKLWWLNFILPIHFVFKPIDDPVNWPSVKSYL